MQKIIDFFLRQTETGATYLQAVILIILVIMALLILFQTICETFSEVFGDENNIKKE